MKKSFEVSPELRSLVEHAVSLTKGEVKFKAKNVEEFEKEVFGELQRITFEVGEHVLAILSKK